MRKVILALVIYGLIFSNHAVAETPTVPKMHELSQPKLPTISLSGDAYQSANLVPRHNSEEDPKREPIKNESINIGGWQGYVDSMSHKESVDMLNLGLKGQVTLYMTGLAMTEPAVLAGVQSANEFSNQTLERSLNTYQLVAEAAKNSGSAIAQQELISLSQCFTEKSKSNKTHDISLLVDVCLNKNKPKESTAIATPNRDEISNFGLNNLLEISK